MKKLKTLKWGLHFFWNASTAAEGGGGTLLRKYGNIQDLNEWEQDLVLVSAGLGAGSKILSPEHRFSPKGLENIFLLGWGSRLPEQGKSSIPSY